MLKAGKFQAHRDKLVTLVLYETCIRWYCHFHFREKGKCDGVTSLQFHIAS